jgi:hypothetical protein
LPEPVETPEREANIERARAILPALLGNAR